MDPTTIVPSRSVSELRTNVISPALLRERTITSEESLTDFTMPLMAWLGICAVCFSVVIVRAGALLGRNA